MFKLTVKAILSLITGHSFGVDQVNLPAITFVLQFTASHVIKQ
jgi:hypothetical protein